MDLIWHPTDYLANKLINHKTPFQDCGLVLDSRVKGKECYPFKNRLYCLKCNRKKLSSEEEDDDDDDTDENSESHD